MNELKTSSNNPATGGLARAIPAEPAPSRNLETACAIELCNVARNFTGAGKPGFELSLAAFEAAEKLSEDGLLKLLKSRVIEDEFTRRYLAFHLREVSEGDALTMMANCEEYFEKVWKLAHKRDLEEHDRKKKLLETLRAKLRAEADVLKQNAARPAKYTESRYVAVANRGEIACRVIEQAHHAGKKVIVIHDGLDLPYAGLLAEGDEVFHVPVYCDRGKRPDGDRLDIWSMKALAAYLKEKEIDLFDVAVHPGWGFNAEDDVWFENMEKLGFRMAGPSSSIIRFLGNKINATEVARQAGLSTPKSSGKVENVDQAMKFFEENRGSIRNFLLKDALGGGGYGQMLLRNPDEWEFKSSVEKFLAKYPVFSADQFLDKTRHIEFQFLSDLDGHVVFGAPRDCTQQRDRQKVIEEAAILPPEVEKAMRSRIAAFLGEIANRNGHPYVGAGTFEFLYEPASETFFFLEVNTRLQVEHPVSAMQDGVNYVLTQLHIADGRKLLSQDEIDARNTGGHSMEARICVERILSEKEREIYLKSGHDRTFGPATGGEAQKFVLPQIKGLSIYADRRFYEGSHWSGRYDSMMMKTVVKGKDRTEAIAILKETAQKLVIEGPGIHTNQELILGILDHEEFVKAETLENRIAVKDVVLRLQIKNETEILKKNIEKAGAPSEFSRLFVSISELTNAQVDHIKTELAALGSLDVFRQALAGKRGGVMGTLAGLLYPTKPDAGGIIKTTIYPAAFALLCKLLQRCGAEPALVINHFEDRKITARKMEDKKVSTDPELVWELFHNYKNDMRKMTATLVRDSESMVTMREHGAIDSALRTLMKELEAAMFITKRESTSTFDGAPAVFYDVPEKVFPLLEQLFVRQRGEDLSGCFEIEQA